MVFYPGFKCELTNVLIVGALSLLAATLPTDKGGFVKSDG